MKPKLLLAVNQLGWSFHNIARQIEHDPVIADTFSVETVLYQGIQPCEADVVVALWWSSLKRLRRQVHARRAIACLYDHRSWNFSSGAQGHFRQTCELADFIAVGNEELLAAVPRTKPAFLVEDGVDTETFSPRPLPDTFTIGWTGNSGPTRHREGEKAIKGRVLIEEACRATNTPLVMQDVIDHKRIDHEEMPAWYGQISAYCCASSSEGTPNPVLEAMACGRPVITTPVGLTRRLVTHGVNGLFVDRSVESIATAIRDMKTRDLNKMGGHARRAVAPQNWKVKILNWRHCLMAALES